MTHGTKPSDQDGLLQLRDALREFAAERDWDQFHTPKNLAIALSVEVGELLEHFQWTGDKDPEQFTPPKLDEVSLEAADVLLYLVRLADKLNIDLIQAAMRKIERNAEKYPVDKVRGSSKKYTEL
ncbi:MAG: nucleotide pyrophosphohydrolase [Gammaproteobacteria bacterium]|nr:nucleotide pyrophosphohydrolase [Gammaproteobacteria bacterium]